MVKHKLPTSFSSVFDHFVVLALKGLTAILIFYYSTVTFYFSIKRTTLNDHRNYIMFATKIEENRTNILNHQFSK